MERIEHENRTAVIVGATSGMGLEVARILHKKGWTIAIAGRRKQRLDEIQEELGERCITKVIDVIREDSTSLLLELIGELGGMDLYFHSAGIGFQNPGLEKWKEIDTVQTNATGFVRMVDAAFNYFCEKGYGHIAVISSIAGVRGLGVAPAYSATKRFQNTYLEALTQLARMKKKNISITDIRPGFVDTSLLKGGKYPMKMKVRLVAHEIVWAIFKNRRTIVVDWRYKIIVAIWRLIPRCLWVRMKVGRLPEDAFMPKN